MKFFLFLPLYYNLLLFILHSYSLANDLEHKEKANLHIIESLDLYDKTLTLLEMQEIWGIIKNNDRLGYIKWGDLPNNSEAIKNDIENKIIFNNKNYTFYPSDFIHGLLSAHAYTDAIEGEIVQFDIDNINNKYNQYLQNWSIFKIYHYPSLGGYYGVTYLNKSTNQVILAHRGTTFQWADLIKKESAVNADLKGILGGQIISQQLGAYKALKDTLLVVNNNNYNFSTTGHSLGAWLAELTIYFSYNDFNHRNIKAVTFDSPGSVLHIDNFKSNIINYDTEFDIKILDITTYLSAPNLVNSCNKHIGKVYRIFPKIILPKAVQKGKKWYSWILDKFGKTKNKRYSMDGLWSLSSHTLDTILTTFDPASGKPSKYLEILDWPAVKYMPRNQRGVTLLHNFVGSIVNIIIPDKILDFANIIKDSTIFNLLTLVDEIAKGNIDQSQYLNYFQYIEDSINTEGNSFEVKQKLLDEELFSLNYEGHYRTKNVDLFTDLLIGKKNKRIADWYLKELKKISQNQLEYNLSGNQLRELREEYDITFDNSHYIITSKKAEIEKIREWALRLARVDPEIKNILENSFNYSNIQNLIGNHQIINFLPMARDINFVEQGNTFKAIDTILTEEQVIIVTGLPGVGLTANILEYAYRKKNNNNKQVVRWFNADSEERIYLDYISILTELGINIDKYTQNKQLMINIINKKLADSNNEFLFIFDNVEEYDHIKDYVTNLPQKVKVIIITRNNNLNPKIKKLQINPFNIAEASTFLKKSNKLITESEINLLLKMLSSKGEAILPYKLVQAISYINNHNLSTISQSIENMKINHYHHHSMIQMLLELLSDCSVAWEILECASHLDSSFISIEVLKEIFMMDEEALQKPLKKLSSLSLIEIINEDTIGIRIPNIINDELEEYFASLNNKKNNIIDTDSEIIIHRLEKALNNLMPLIGKSFDHNWKKAELIYTHIVKILTYYTSQSVNTARGHLYTKLCIYNEYALHNYNKSLEYAQSSLGINRALYKGDHPEIADALSNISWSYFHLGDISKAISYQNQVLSIRQKLYKKDHLKIADSLSSMGRFYFVLGNDSKALSFSEKALNIRRKIIKNVDPLIATSIESIGVIYHEQGKLQKALDYYKHALKIRQELFQGPHLDIANSLNDISRLYIDLDDPTTALEYGKQALKIQQELYQTNHPEIATSTNLIGRAYQDLGEVNEALVYYDKALKMRQALYKDQHYTITHSLNNIGEIYRLQGKKEEALNFYNRAIEMQKNLYQNDHADTAVYLNNIGETYFLSGELSEALAYYNQALNMQRKLKKENHINTPLYLTNIGNVYFNLKNFTQALDYYTKALKIQLPIYPTNTNKMIAKTLIKLGDTNRNLNNYEQAINNYKEAYNILIQYQNMSDKEIHYLQNIISELETK